MTFWGKGERRFPALPLVLFRSPAVKTRGAARSSVRYRCGLLCFSAASARMCRWASTLTTQPRPPCTRGRFSQTTGQRDSAHSCDGAVEVKSSVLWYHKWFRSEALLSLKAQQRIFRSALNFSPRESRLCSKIWTQGHASHYNIPWTCT